MRPIAFSKGTFSVGVRRSAAMARTRSRASSTLSMVSNELLTVVVLPASEIRQGGEIVERFYPVGKVAFRFAAFLLPAPHGKIVLQRVSRGGGQFTVVQREQRLAPRPVVGHCSLRSALACQQTCNEIAGRVRGIDRHREQPTCFAVSERRRNAGERTAKPLEIVGQHLYELRVFVVVAIGANHDRFAMWTQSVDDKRNDRLSEKRLNAFVQPTEPASLPARENSWGDGCVFRRGRRVHGASALLRFPDQAAALLHLSFRQFVLSTGKRIFVFAKFDSDRSTFELEAFAEKILEITPITVAYAFRAAAMDHNSRRIAAARMRKAQFRRVAAYERRLITFVRFFESAREFRRSEFARGGCVGAIDRAHQLGDARTVQRRNRHDARIRDEIQFARK